MKNRNSLIILSILALGGMPLAAVAGSCGSSKATAASYKHEHNIVETAANAGAFNTLLAAAQAAGLADTLANGGPFTVFAPTDDAFAALPAGTVETLLKPENKDKLAAILTYHVVAGKVMAADVQTGKVATVNGKKVSLKVKYGKVTVNGAKVVQADVVASNGVIHVIDAVILPPEGDEVAMSY